MPASSRSPCWRHSVAWRRTSSRSRPVIAVTRWRPFDRPRARPGQVDRDLGGHATRAAGQDQHAVAQADRLAHVVGDEQHREAAIGPEALQLVMQ